MDIFKSLFGNLFKQKKQQYQANVRAQIHRNTLGKVQSRASDAMAEMDRKVYGAQHAVEDRIKGKTRKKAPGGQDNNAPQPAPKAQGGGGGGGGKAPGRAPGRGPGRAPGGQAPTGPGARPAGGWLTAPPQAGGRPAGPPQAQRAQPQGGFGRPAGGVPNYSAQGAGGAQERTQAIDIRGLEKAQQQQVVGWIVAQSGNHRGMDFRLFDGKNVIGTAANCDLVVTDPYLSARHCTIRYENGNFMIIDLDSRNGTYVNQKRISKEELIDNDTVRLGKTEFKFKALY